jgi:hypothetical protein
VLRTMPPREIEYQTHICFAAGRLSLLLQQHSRSCPG